MDTRKSQTAFEEWYKSHFGSRPVDALNCKEHRGMSYGGVAPETAWIAWQAAYKQCESDNSDIMC